MNPIFRGRLCLLASLTLCPLTASLPAHAAATPTPTKTVLTDGTRTVVRAPGDLGITFDKDGKASADLVILKRSLERLAPKFAQDPVDARPFLFQGTCQFSPGQDGRTLNVASTAEAIIATLKDHPETTTLSVVEEKKPPTLTVERLKGITGVLGSYETRATSDRKRNNNITIAVQRIDGTLLSPGETFSLNQTVGKRTQAAGFKTAHVFIDAKIVDGIGGGVSQVTGTLFNAAALAGLTIKEVNPHSRPVAYIPLGRDATVAYGDKDLRFTNNTKAPVYIAYSFQKRSVHATIWGAKVPGRLISLRPRVHEIAPGKINAQLYRVTKENGKIVNKELLFRHAYRWTP